MCTSALKKQGSYLLRPYSMASATVIPCDTELPLIWHADRPPFHRARPVTEMGRQQPNFVYSPTNPCASINVQTHSATCLFPYYYQLWLVLSLLINLMTRSSLLLLTFSGPSAPTQLCRGACQRHLCDAVRDLPCSRGCVGLHLRVGGGIRAAAEVSRVWTFPVAGGALSFIWVHCTVHNRPDATQLGPESPLSGAQDQGGSGDGPLKVLP